MMLRGKQPPHPSNPRTPASVSSDNELKACGWLWFCSWMQVGFSALPCVSLTGTQVEGAVATQGRIFLGCKAGAQGATPFAQAHLAPAWMGCSPVYLHSTGKAQGSGAEPDSTAQQAEENAYLLNSNSSTTVWSAYSHLGRRPGGPF